MKILWVNTHFMHPTTKGGQIRTLEMLRELHQRHEIHYVAFEDPHCSEGPARASEYSTRSYPYRYQFADRRSAKFVFQVGASVFQSTPVGITRFRVPALGPFLAQLAQQERFDRAVCDFLHPASYFPNMERTVLFQHNVETMIWRRYAQHASNALRRWYLGLQAERMYRFERDICLKAGHVVAVSDKDASTMRELFGLTKVSSIPTGVNIQYLKPPATLPPLTTDLVFVGSLDWLPNVDGMEWFVREVLPLIRRSRPDCTLTIVGRLPPHSITTMSEQDSQIRVSGTVPDIRPYLWGSAISIVPLRIGGGTRLKIYESMAAGVPVVSTSVGAEGLEIHPPDDIRIADSPEAFAAACLELLSAVPIRLRMAAAALDMVTAKFSWKHVALCFERILEDAPRYY